MSEAPRHPTIAEIQAAVVERFGLRMADMAADKRARRYARPRQVAMYLARTLTPLSLPAIGREFGDRDHTTVLHACRLVPFFIDDDEDLAAAVADIVSRLADPNQLSLSLA